MRWHLLFFFFIVSAAFATGVAAVALRNSHPVTLHTSGWYDRAWFDGAYAQAERIAADAPRSLLVAHHLLVADKIAAVFAAAADDSVDTVIVVSPNHFSRGASAAQIARGSWTTPYGTLLSNDDAVTALLAASDTLRHEEDTFAGEHGVSAITPFIARSFPRAKIVAIAVDESLPPSDATALGTLLAATLPNAVLVASVDMSHNLPDAINAYHDDETLRVIENGGCASACDLEVDSNATLRTLFAWNAARGTQAWRLTHHGSALAMGATDDWQQNTSHILGFFTDGVAEHAPFASWFLVADKRFADEAAAAQASPSPWDDVHRLWRGAHTIVTDRASLPDEVARHVPDGVLTAGILHAYDGITVYPITLTSDEGSAAPVADPHP